ncbi:MAG: PRC-barrel domain-containing protein, partial [Steroidobacter sp.]
MLRTFADLTRLSIGATDGEIGAVKDAYFDDHEWTLRYLVVATGNWLTGGRVLITPISIRGADWD